MQWPQNFDVRVRDSEGGVCVQPFKLTVNDHPLLANLRWYGASFGSTPPGSAAVQGSGSYASGYCSSVAGGGPTFANITADNHYPPSYGLVTLHFVLTCTVVNPSQATVRVAYNNGGSIDPFFMTSGITGSGVYTANRTVVWTQDQQGWQIISGVGFHSAGSVVWSLKVSVL